MYPSAYYTYNPSRLRRAERAYYNKHQQGEETKFFIHRVATELPNCKKEKKFAKIQIR